MKKIITLLIISIMFVSSFCVTSYGNETIKIGGVNENFVKILEVSDGITYLPIRLAFTNLNNNKYSIKITPYMNAKAIKINMVRRNADGKAIDGQGRFVEILWDDESKGVSDGKGVINAYVYKSTNGIMSMEFLNNSEYAKFGLNDTVDNALYYDVKIQNVQGGERVFLSLEDLNRIIKFLVDNTDYEVELK